MIRGFLAEMGNPRSPVEQAAAIRAAELTVASENGRAKLLAGNGDANEVVRLENLAGRAVRHDPRTRVNAGLARATAKGIKLGRPRTSSDVETRIRKLRAKDMGVLKIARTLGIGTSVVQRVVAAEAPV
jgi:hypothetical protein